MKTTLILAIAGCLLLFEMIWVATITMPFSALAKNFPLDIQEKLRPRIENLPMIITGRKQAVSWKIA